MPAPVVLHGLLPGEGPLATLVDVLAFGVLLLTVLALVLLGEDGSMDRRRKLLAGAGILFLPLVGPLVYLWHRRSRDPSR